VSTYDDGDGNTQTVDTVRAADVGRTYVREHREDGDWLVPCVSVLFRYELASGEIVRVNEHLSLDARSRSYRSVDPLFPK